MSRTNRPSRRTIRTWAALTKAHYANRAAAETRRNAPLILTATPATCPHCGGTVSADQRGHRTCPNEARWPGDDRQCPGPDAEAQDRPAGMPAWAGVQS
jgi:hypothetical protein